MQPEAQIDRAKAETKKPKSFWFTVRAFTMTFKQGGVSYNAPRSFCHLQRQCGGSQNVLFIYPSKNLRQGR